MHPMYARFKLAGKTYEGKVLNACPYANKTMIQYERQGKILTLDLPTATIELIPNRTPKTKPRREDSKRPRLQRYRPQRLAPMTKEMHGGEAGNAPELAQKVRKAERRAHRLPLIRRAWRKMRRGKTTTPTFRPMTRTELLTLQRAAILATMPENVRFAYLERERERRERVTQARRKWRRAQLMKAYRSRV